MEQHLEKKIGWEHWLGYGGLGMLLLFIFLPSSYYLMVAFPWIFLWQGGFFLLGIALLVMIRKFEIPFRPLGYGLDWAVGAVAIACVISAIFAPFKGVAFLNLATISGYGVVLYVLRNWLHVGRWTWQNLWRGLVVIGFAMSTSSLLEWALLDGSSDRTRLPLGHHNFVAAYLCLLLPIVFSFALAQTGKTRILLLLLAAVLPVNIYTCSSRGGLVGLFLWAIATVAFVIWRTKGRKRMIYSSVALGVITVMAIAALQNPRVQQIIQVDTSQGLIPTVNFKVDGETEDRLFMWQAGFHMLQDRPLTGVGLGNMSRLYNFYRPINVGAGAAHIQQLHGTPAHLLGELGLIGGLAIAFLLVQLLRLGWHVHGLTEDFTARRLLYGLGGGWFAYAMAALTDYQLENIPISLTLTLTVVALVAIADRTLPAQIPAPLSESHRRLLSLTSLGATLSALMAALPFSVSMGFFAQGQSLWAQNNAEQAFEKIAIAETINPWNPVYPLRLGLWLLETREFQRDQPAQYKKSTELAVAYFQDAWTMAPNDFYFNTNVAVLLIELDSPLAHQYLERAVQLLPRESGFSYLMLGYAYAQQGRKEEAIAAYALQGLTDPSLLTMGNWEREPLIDIRIPAIEKCLGLYQTLLDRLPPDAPERLDIQERMAWISWWHDLPVPYLDEVDQFSPVVQVLILGDRQPEKALAIIETELAKPDLSLGLKTRWESLKAWFDPEFDLDLSLKTLDNQTLQEYVLVTPTDPDVRLQDWLKQIPLPTKYRAGRTFSRLTYRIEDFEAIDSILLPPAKVLEQFQLVSLLDLGGGYPRTFPVLDHLIEQVLIEDLNLPHPPAHPTLLAP